MNRFVVSGDPAEMRPDKINVRSDSNADPELVWWVSLEVKEPSMDQTDLHTDHLADQAISATVPHATTCSSLTGRRLPSPVRITLASNLGQDLDGAWWPHSVSIARELPGLIDALRSRLGDVIDIGVNWTSLQGVPDLDALNRRGSAAHVGGETCRQRVITITGSSARAKLLVVPCGTTRALAVMVLRQAAALPILSVHQDTQAFRTADGIVRAARAENALRASVSKAQPEALSAG